MVMLTSADAIPKSAAILGIAVVSTVPSRNSMKNVAATSKANLGCHVDGAALIPTSLEVLLMVPLWMGLGWRPIRRGQLPWHREGLSVDPMFDSPPHPEHDDRMLSQAA